MKKRMVLIEGEHLGRFCPMADLPREMSYAVIGPFGDMSHDPDLQEALRYLLKVANRDISRTGGWLESVPTQEEA